MKPPHSRLSHAILAVGVLSLFIVGGVFLFQHSPSIFGREKGSVAVLSGAENKTETQQEQTKKREPAVFLERFQWAKNRLLADNKSFLEVNLEARVVSYFKDGQLVSHARIVTAGDPQGWGGTPAGLYEVLGKNESAYSSISQVYMPYAIHFYGKYLVHGIPYYPNGEKLASDISGGCVRVEDEELASIFNQIGNRLPVLVLDKKEDRYEYLNQNETISLPPEITAQSYLAADLDSGFVFAEKEPAQSHPIASLTKLMTATVVSEQVDLRSSIKVTGAMLAAYGSTPGFTEGERYRVVELFYPLLINSSNDAAEALAGFLGRDSTVRLMNKKAESIFMENTHFTDPSGLDIQNRSTAQDLFYLARYVHNTRPPLLEITKGNIVRSFGEIGFDIEKLYNKNGFEKEESFIGGKTGYLHAARYTGVLLFRVETEDGTERNIAIIMLGSDNLISDTTNLYEWIQKEYRVRPGAVAQ